MAKDPEFPKDEYKLDEEQPPLETGDEVVVKRSLFKRLLSNRRFMLLLIVVIAVFVVYQFLGNSTDIKEDVAQFEQKPLQQTTVVTQTPVQPVITAPEITAEQNKLDTLAQQTQQNQMQIQQLQNNVQQLQNTVTQMTIQVAALTSSVNTLQTTMTIKPVLKKIAKVKKEAPRPVYFVRALIPGRAWLQENENRGKGERIVRLLTVKVGDFLPGYGRVQGINVEEGKVLTSWGSVIRYANRN